MPCVFYSDYYGNPVQNRPLVPDLGKLMKTRYLYSYGEQRDYFDDPNVIGWVRGGDQEHAGSGLAVVLSDAEGGTKRMYMGEQFAGRTFCDMMGKCPEEIVIGDDGWADFRTEGGSVAVWTTREAFENLIVNE